MKIIITSEMAKGLVAIGLVASIEALKENAIICDELPVEQTVFPIHNNIDDVKHECYFLEKEPSWTKFNKGRYSKRQRRKHNP